MQVVVLRMSRVSTIDATGAGWCSTTPSVGWSGAASFVLLSGLRPGHDRALGALGVVERLRGRGPGLRRQPGAAIDHARAYLASDAASPAGLTPA